MDPRAIVNERKMFVSLSEYGELVPEYSKRSHSILRNGYVARIKHLLNVTFLFS